MQIAQLCKQTTQFAQKLRNTKQIKLNVLVVYLAKIPFLKRTLRLEGTSSGRCHGWSASRSTLHGW